MSRKESAGLLLFRQRDGGLDVLLAHPGGPFWQNRDAGAWTIPKGGIDPGETPLDAAIREFTEETGLPPTGPFLPLGSIIQLGGKVVHAWAFERECDPAGLKSATVMTEWPPRSGRRIEVPELDRYQFFGIDAARRAINVAQAELLVRLVRALEPR